MSTDAPPTADPAPGRATALDARNFQLHDPQHNGDTRQDPAWRALLGLPPLTKDT